MCTSVSISVFSHGCFLLRYFLKSLMDSGDIGQMIVLLSMCPYGLCLSIPATLHTCCVLPVPLGLWHRAPVMIPHVALAPAALTWPRLGLDLSSNREDMKASQWRKGVSFGSQVFLISLPGQGLFNQFSYFLFLQHSVLLSMLPNYIFDHTEHRFWCQTAWIEFSSNGNTL